MKPYFLNVCKAALAAITICSIANKQALANINAIDIDKVHYPKAQQENIDFLKNNVSLYNHWTHDWKYKLTKAEVVAKLTTLYDEIDKVSPKTEDAELLLGDIAHYLYNMETEAYFKEAIAHYQAAQQMAPQDYRVYWFMGNHYALAAVPASAIENYHKALQYLPKSQPPAYFWADYAVASADAGMPANALYAARQSSQVAGAKTFIEEQMSRYKNGVLRPIPADTIIPFKQAWRAQKQADGRIGVINWSVGLKFSADSTWKIIQAGDYNKGTTYLMMKPQTETAKDGQRIDYSIMLFVQRAGENETLQQFLNKLTQKMPSKKPTAFDVGALKNCLAYEMTDPAVYAKSGGAHMYAIGIERNTPEYPGMALEEPLTPPKGEAGKMNYYTSTRKYSRAEGKMYYLIMLDSCEYIHDQSLANLKKLLASVVVE